MLRIAVCDDELIFQNRISDMIKAQLGKCQIECDISCFQSGKIWLKQVNNRQISRLFS